MYISRGGKMESSGLGNISNGFSLKWVVFSTCLIVETVWVDYDYNSNVLLTICRYLKP